MSQINEQDRKRNELAIQIADILNQYGFDEVKEKLAFIRNDISLPRQMKKSKRDWDLILNSQSELSENEFDSSNNWGCCSIGARLQIEKPEIAEDFASETNSYNPKRILTPKAYSLGYDFCRAIKNKNRESASAIHKQIHSLPRILKTEEELKKYDRSFIGWVCNRVGK